MRSCYFQRGHSLEAISHLRTWSSHLKSLVAGGEIKLKIQVAELAYVHQPRLREEVAQFFEAIRRQKRPLSLRGGPDDQKTPFNHAEDRWRQSGDAFGGPGLPDL